MNLVVVLLLYFMEQGVGVDGAGDSMCIWQGQRLGEWFLGSGKNLHGLRCVDGSTQAHRWTHWTSTSSQCLLYPMLWHNSLKGLRTALRERNQWKRVNLKIMKENSYIPLKLWFQPLNTSLITLVLMRVGDWDSSVSGLFIVSAIKFEALSTGNFKILHLPFPLYYQLSLSVKVDEKIFW